MILMRKIIFISAILMFLLAGCKEENLLKPYGPLDNTPPKEVSNIEVKNLPGGAVLRYDLPDDADLFYVKGIYQNSKGQQMEARSAAYTDSIRINGFGDTNEYTVKLYAVDHSENASSGVSATINPLTPSITSVFESIKHTIDFGGFYVDFENKNKENIAIYAMARDEATQEFAYFDSYYTSLESGRYAVRGLPPEENDFAVYVRDRYDNNSDTLYFTGSPYKEDELNKKIWRNYPLTGDVSFNYYSGLLENAWDGKVNEWLYAHTNFPVEFPHRFTVDLGVSTKLSRMHMWQRSRWEHGSWKFFKVYGMLDKPKNPSAQNPMEEWILLGEFESIKPSGLPMGQNSAEDLEKYALGEEFPFERTIPIVRYIRVEILDSWSGMLCSTMSEISFWGEVQEETDNEDNQSTTQP